MTETFRTAIDTITQHIPTGAPWLPLTLMVAAVVLGLLMLLRGGKLSPAFAASTFLAGGGLLGWFLAGWRGLPVWPSMVIVGVVGFVLGLVLFRLWMAVLLSTCFALVGLVAYGAKLQPYLATFTTDNFDTAEGLVQLPGATPEAAVVTTPAAELTRLWLHLSANAPGFRLSVFAIVLASTVAGLALGFFFPRLSRALWAATVGTALFTVGTIFLLDAAAPPALNWLGQHVGQGVWLALPLIWAASLAINLRDLRPRPNAKQAAKAKAAKPAAAAA